MNVMDWLVIGYCVVVVVISYRTFFNRERRRMQDVLVKDRATFGVMFANYDKPLGMWEYFTLNPTREYTIQCRVFDNDPVWFQYATNRWARTEHHIIGSSWQRS